MRTFFLNFALSLAMTAAVIAQTKSSRPELALGRTAEYDYDVPEPGTYTLPVMKPAADGTVLNAGGKPVRLHALTGGRITVLSFIYTRCADPRACLRASGVLQQLQRLTNGDPTVSSRLLLLSLSFDPAHDTPEVMSRYGSVFSKDEGGADWHFLTTQNREQLAPLLEHYGQQVDRAKAGSVTGPLSHPLRVYLIDGQRRIRNIYSFGLLDPRLVMTDVRTLIAEESASTDAHGAEKSQGSTAPRKP